MGRGGLLEASYRHYFEVRHLKRFVRLERTMSVLELGSGNGRWILSLAPLVKHYTAVDFSRQALDVARKGIRAAGLDNVELHEQSILDFRGDGRYDVIYLAGVTQYLQDEEIRRLMENLAPHIGQGTVIVDRSTINVRAREILERDGYYAIFRTPAELRALLARHGFHGTYQRRSYRFMRGGRLLQAGPLKRIMPVLVRALRPVSLYLLLGYSWLADVVRPIPFEGGDRSHDFFVFRRDDRADA
jgi:SAM-dependent methyltransferase